MASNDVAIIGMACRFAGDAKSPEAFHEMLMEKRDAWSKIPSSRFNVDAFLHPSKDRSGTLVCKGGYFLDGDITKWDAPFFTCSASEARSYDPQQRLLLETAYESLESAGIPISSLAGTDTACFVGAFSEDYKLIVSRDMQSAPKYAKTGTALSILSNRISWFFDLKGPSLTCDTACSSSLAALHLACETIKSSSNSTRCALVGGANLILDPDDQCGLNALGFFSPESRCFSLDSRANGYARGEGIGVLVLKHIDDAIRDGDPIRAVIRGTGLNSDGKTAGITLPSAEAQARLIKATYKHAGLDPACTQYVELHGTGTKAGDSAEVRAISEVIATHRSQPLYCGSVKSRVGHTEAAAGMAALIKSVLCLEKAMITPNLNFRSANPRLKLTQSNIIVPTSVVPWPDCEVRRCSINNFGFGGTNAHVIIDDASNYLRLRGLASPARGLALPQAQGKSQPKIFVLSAPEQIAIKRQRAAYAHHIDSKSFSGDMRSLARTLSERRSLFQWRHAVVAASQEELASCWRNDTIKPVKQKNTNTVAFVFTGQGAQWCGMGQELVSIPVFADSIRQSADYLSMLGCTWDAWTELMDPNMEVTAKIKQAEYSQPLCSILQIALVDLLRHWGVRPQSVIGHSSGEIAAAYAAEIISREDCIKIAYNRGIVSREAQIRQPGGSMMAVGMSASRVSTYLHPARGSVVIACINSPESVTLAGDSVALGKLGAAFNEEKIFSRMLQVENAYHSPQMQSVAAMYKESIESISPLSGNASVEFYSTVRGSMLAATALDADYWVENLCSPVNFVDSLDAIMYGNDSGKGRSKTQPGAPSVLLEIGPHSALAGPIKQYRVHRTNMESLAYCSLLERGQDASLTSLRAAASLWTRGVPVQLAAVNGVDESDGILTGLPSYQWNHSTSYWHESRQSQNHRSPSFAKHDLLGSLIDNYNPLEPVWKNYLRITDLPWLSDHMIEGDVVFPAAGMLCSAIEAARQIAALEGSGDISSFELREISISRALVIPDGEFGAEVYVNLKRRKLGMGSGPGAWFEFSYYSCLDKRTFCEHASGLIQVEYAKEVTEIDNGKELEEAIAAYNRHWDLKTAQCVDKVTKSSHYRFCDEQGLHFGKTFQGLRTAYQSAMTVSFEVGVSDTRACMPEFHESNYLIHPATLDSVFQAMMIAVPRMENVEKQVWVPTGASYMRISAGIDRSYGATLRGLAESSITGAREMTSSVLVRDNKGDTTLPTIILEGFKFTGLGSSQRPIQASDALASKLYSTPLWKPDVDLIDASHVRLLSQVETDNDAMARFCALADNVLREVCRKVMANLIHLLNPSLPPHLLKFAEWMRKRCDYDKDGTITPESPVKNDALSQSTEMPELAVIQMFMEQYPVDGKIFQHVYHALGAIFAQETTGIATLKQDDLLTKAYQEVYGLHINAAMLGTWFELKAHKKPTLRVLEVGAGTASTTLPLLRRLSQDGSDTPLFTSWSFTDISAGWFEGAKSLLHQWHDRVEYKVLDIDQDPIRQGFEPNSYDVILAVNVLHATKNIRNTLRNCNVLLKPGGNLVLGEYTNINDIGNFAFGIMPGWWSYEDDRTSGPLLTQSQWHDALSSTGFSGADLLLADNESPTAHRMSTIVSKKPVKTACRNIMVILPTNCSNATKELGTRISRCFQHFGHGGSVAELPKAAMKTHGKSIISLLDYEASFFQDATETDFNNFQKILLDSHELLWVTRSDPAEAPGDPRKRMISGVMRCAKMEDTSRLLYELHLSRLVNASHDATISIIYQRLQSIWETAVIADSHDEMETEERSNTLYIPRYVPYKAMNDSLAYHTDIVRPKPEIGDLLQPQRPLKLSIGHPGMLDTLHFVDDTDMCAPLRDNEVEIEVRSCALNFLDIMIAMGQIPRSDLGHEACGVITRIGRTVHKLSEGDRVVFVGPAAMKTHIRADESIVQRIPDKMSFAEAVSIPIAYATAYRSLVEVARLEKGESVLIHAAAGGLGQALIQIAKMLQADIFCTVGSDAKRSAIMSMGIKSDHILSSRDLSFVKGIKRMTNGRGVDVVVNSLAGEALRQSWSCIAPYGRFIEVGKKDILGNTGLDMGPLINNTMVAGVNLESMMVEEPLRCREIVSKVFGLFEDGLIDSIKPIVIRNFTDIESTFRDMQRGSHIGKLVLEATMSSRVPIMPKKAVSLRLKADATYLLVGGLGGLGRAQAIFMANNGARHIAFLSRSGDARPQAKDVISNLLRDGVNVRSFAVDVSDASRLAAVLHEIAEEMPPICGVIQGAMVLDDGLFHNMSHSQWMAAIKPKVQGTWNLHKQLPDNLDFFIVLSSLAGVLGSLSQANYAAGNTFQDALMRYRRQKGLPGQSFDLGVMKDIGYVEEHEDARARTSQLRLTSLGEKEFMHALRCALARSIDGSNALLPQILVGAGSGGIQQLTNETDSNADFYWLRSLAAFSYMNNMDIQSKVSAGREGGDETTQLIDEFKSCQTMDQANNSAQRLLIARIAKHMSIPTSDIDTDKPIHDYGIDSLVAVELRNWLSLELKSELTIFDLTGNDAISESREGLRACGEAIPLPATFASSLKDGAGIKRSEITS
ncbi:hypothetical protein NLG97_g1664 [Lecanicillium saksenae]|uniref:Uncharacterized protein n=1 Tax=Lecanicillium saksenae TaxID=468837 RepID=A0ACC1R4Z3_9HYPO|nr:hypothetical protein NLG97_g1664 [Lecanicillium saksenae]